MSTSIMSNSLLNAAAGMLQLLTGFGCSVLVARLLGPDANGVVAFALWVAVTGALIAELGTGMLLMRFIPELRARGASERERRGFAAYLALPVFLSTTVITLAYCLVSWRAEAAHWLEASESVVVLTGILLFIQSIGSITKNYLIGEQRVLTLLRITALSSALQISFVLAGAIAGGTVGALAGYIAGQAVQFFYTVRIFATPRNAAGYETKFLATTSAILFVEYVIGAIFFSRPELFFLQHFRSVGEVGLYAVALSLANLALQLPVQLTGSLIPFYAERRELDGGMLSADVFHGVMRSFAYITLPLCLGLASISIPLVVAVYGNEFAQSGLIVAILAAGSPAYVFVQLAAQYLYSMGKVTARLAISGLGAAIMVVGCVVVVPIWGGPGAAVVRGIVFAAMGLLLIRRVQLKAQASGQGTVLAKVTIAAILCGGAAWTVTELVPGLVGVAISICAGAVVYFLMLRFLRAIPVEDAVVMDRLVSRMPSGLGRASRRLVSLLVPAQPSQVAAE
ncbi:polysaccharide biosynthesis C-terminal domain-containing protein [Sinorhizobium sp. BG8]|uniref:lipopolysaccharide biosynthesis protein n=1 Tax=Sinorhizobium sp. BG8 TaxID=2613773 RepID=UPI00193E6ABC|nr:polysaccharide biosynthesis C-terminal domain-containing protein [Sinorhizobium sp. BG8]QRM53731.1 oligosaccharide flippase family protein [Sinorhizobium sp. BG8]